MKYIIKFKKTGVICFTSHLDIMKVFKRSFKRAGISLAFSQGFNPHPKMGFAQPLSLGYEGLEEYIEFDTAEEEKKTGREIIDSLRTIMPEGLELVSLHEAPELTRTLAAETVSARYSINIPLSNPIHLSSEEIFDKYMGKEEILAFKKQKKKKELLQIDIKPKIRDIVFTVSSDSMQIDALLDSGSESNLSPELVISTLLDTLCIDTPRNEINVTRKKIFFKNY